MHNRETPSHLLQMRGLKLTFKKKQNPAPVSHLLQMRGLKHFDCTAQLPISRSHLLQMRGLKLDSDNSSVISLSRIFYRCVD